MECASVATSRFAGKRGRDSCCRWGRQRGQSSIMVSFSGGGGGAALGSPAGILVLLVIIALVGAVYWLFNR